MKILKKMLAAVMLITAAACGVSEKVSEGELNVRFFNAGKADAILLYTDESAVLIDCGESGYGSTVLSFLRENGIDSLDAMIITHFDKDHVGGAAEVLSGIETKQVLVSNSPKDSDEYDAFVQALQEADAEASVITGSDAYEFVLDGVSYSVDGPDETVYDSNPSNNSSLIISVTYGDTSFLLAGDAQNDRIEEYLQDHSGTYDVLKVPYHGNYQKKLKDLIASASPQTAVITCSSSEGGEEKTLQLLEEAGIDTYLTWQGDVTVTSDGTAITVQQ